MENLSIIRTIYEFKDYFREGGDLQRSELLGSGIKMNSIEDSQSIDGYFKKKAARKTLLWTAVETIGNPC